MRDRRWLLARLRALLPAHGTLASALLALPCAGYARAVDVLYGDRFACVDDAACTSLSGVRLPDGRVVPTVSWRAFQRAAALQRYSGRITWVLRTAPHQNRPLHTSTP